MNHKNIEAMLIALLCMVFIVLSGCGTRDDAGPMQRFDMKNKTDFGTATVAVIVDRTTGQEYLIVRSGGVAVVPIETGGK